MKCHTEPKMAIVALEYGEQNISTDKGDFGKHAIYAQILELVWPLATKRLCLKILIHHKLQQSGVCKWHICILLGNRATVCRRARLEKLQVILYCVNNLTYAIMHKSCFYPWSLNKTIIIIWFVLWCILHLFMVRLTEPESESNGVAGMDFSVDWQVFSFLYPLKITSVCNDQWKCHLSVSGTNLSISFSLTLLEIFKNLQFRWSVTEVSLPAYWVKVVMKDQPEVLAVGLNPNIRKNLFVVLFVFLALFD